MILESQGEGLLIHFPIETIQGQICFGGTVVLVWINSTQKWHCPSENADSGQAVIEAIPENAGKRVSRV